MAELDPKTQELISNLSTIVKKFNESTLTDQKDILEDFLSRLSLTLNLINSRTDEVLKEKIEIIRKNIASLTEVIKAPTFSSEDVRVYISAIEKTLDYIKDRSDYLKHLESIKDLKKSEQFVNEDVLKALFSKLSEILSLYSGLVALRRGSAFLTAIAPEGVSRSDLLNFLEPIHREGYASLAEYARWQRELAFMAPKLLQEAYPSTLATLKEFREAFASFGFEGDTANRILGSVIRGLADASHFSTSYSSELERVRKEFHLGREMAREFNMSQTDLLNTILKADISFKNITTSSNETAYILGIVGQSVKDLGFTGEMTQNFVQKLTNSLSSLSLTNLAGLGFLTTGRLLPVEELVGESPTKMFFETMRSFVSGMPSELSGYFISSFAQMTAGIHLTAQETVALQRIMEKGNFNFESFSAKLKEFEDKRKSDTEKGRELLTQIVDPVKNIQNILSTSIVPLLDKGVYFLELYGAFQTFSSIISIPGLGSSKALALGVGAVAGGYGLKALSTE